MYLNINNLLNLVLGYLFEREGSSRILNVVFIIFSEKKVIVWFLEGLVELNKVLGFVWGKVKCNMEKYVL